MAAFLFFATVGIIGYVMYLGWTVSVWLRMPERVLAKQAARLAREAAKAASNGRYAESARLDDARNAILTGLAGQKWEFAGTEHDDPFKKYTSGN